MVVSVSYFFFSCRLFPLLCFSYDRLCILIVFCYSIIKEQKETGGYNRDRYSFYDRVSSLVLIAQLKGVNEEYWILPFNPVFIFFESIYIFSSLKDSKFSSLHISELEMGVFLLFISLLVVNLFSKAKKEVIMETLLIISVFLSPLLFGIIYSMLIKPIFITRYINCFVGPFFLGLAILVSYVDFSKKKNIILLGFFYLLLFSIEFTSLFSQDSCKKTLFGKCQCYYSICE